MLYCKEIVTASKKLKKKKKERKKERKVYNNFMS
jgi:hypothetical protein